ncbi:MAG: SMP-30/gluconolactonase/LRE family protein, partial [Sphingobacteriales bacterium]
KKGGADGFKIDSKGNLYVTAPGGVWIYDKSAKLLGRILVPEATSNVAFADNEKTLFITADRYVLKVTLRR